MPNVKRTIQDALIRISHPQPVHLDPSVNEARRQMRIEVLPPLLVIHFKRSLYDPAVGGVANTGKPIQFTPDIEIPPCTASLFLFHRGQPILKIHRGFVGLDIRTPIAQNQIVRSRGATLSTAYSITVVSRQAGDK
jgi:hypothetical protein